MDPLVEFDCLIYLFIEQIKLILNLKETNYLDLLF